MIIGNLISEEYSYAIVWTLIHSLWQAGLIYLLLYLLFEFSFFKTSARKYWTAYLALPILIITSIVSFQYLHESAKINIPHHYQVPINIINTDANFIENSALQANQNVLEKFTLLVNNHSSELVWIWMIGLLLFSLRIVFGLSYLEKLRFSSSKMKDDKWQRKVDQMLQLMGCNRLVEIAESTLVDAPQLLGHFKPIILFPIGLINQLNIEEVESILIHELSHVVRQDFLFNVFQTIMENVYFFNPFVHLISKVIRKEREFACDDSSRGMVNNDIHYAKALYRIGEEAQNKSFALGFGGHKNYLLQRVERIFNQTKHTTHYMEKIMTSTLLLALIVLLSMAASVGESPAKLEVNEMYSEKIIPQTEMIAGMENSDEDQAFIPLDTLPNERKSNCEMMWFDDGSRVDVSYENGKISSLRINGKKIAEEDYSKYEQRISGKKNELEDRVFNLNAGNSSMQASMLYPAMLSQITDSMNIDSIIESVERMLIKGEDKLEHALKNIEENVWHIKIDSQDVADARKEAEFQISVWENKIGDKKVYIDSIIEEHPLLEDIDFWDSENFEIYIKDLRKKGLKFKKKLKDDMYEYEEELNHIFEKMDSAKVFHMKEWDFSPDDLPNGIKLDSIMIHINEKTNNLNYSIDSVMHVYRLNLEDFMDDYEFNSNESKATKKEKAERWKEYKKYLKEEKAKKKRELKSY